MAEIYEYTRLGVCPAPLTAEINANVNITSICLAVTVTDNDQVSVIMSGVLSEPEEIELETVVMAHVCAPDNTIDDPGEGEENPDTGVIESYAEMCLVYSESQLTNKDWIQIGAASDSDSGVIMPLNGVITKITAHVEQMDKGDVSKWLDLYVNENEHTKIVEFGPNTTASHPVDTLHTISGNDKVYDQRRVRTNVNIPFNAGEKIRLRCNTSNRSKLYDTVITLWFKWRVN